MTKKIYEKFELNKQQQVNIRSLVIESMMKHITLSVLRQEYDIDYEDMIEKSIWINTPEDPMKELQIHIKTEEECQEDEIEKALRN
jgi:hypothetical protein